ncbi:MAG TPA: hypothetical protein VKV74_18115 [Bryobacteraceae bacterium]|nr:hypothetical protein [Bryobacteraceae bacterium]
MNNDKESAGASPAKDGEERTRSGMSKDEVALELTRFIATTTGLGKSAGSAGFSGKASKTPEEHADTLLQLFQRCRAVINKG